MSNYPPYLFTTPIAVDGDRLETIPATSQSAGTGRLSQAKGWTEVNSTSVSAGGVPPKREDFNTALYMISSFLVWAQQGGLMNYTATLDYEVGNEVMYDSKKWRCVQENGPSSTTVAPGSSTEYWKDMDSNVPAGCVMPFYNVALGGSDGRRPIFWGQTQPDEGWVLCDGGDDGLGGNVPDMTGRFIYGSSVAESGGTGGSETQTTSATGGTGSVGETVLTVDQIPSHTHAGTVATAGNHTHGGGDIKITGAFSGYEFPRSVTTTGCFYDATSEYPDLQDRGGSGHTGSSAVVGFDSSRSGAISGSTAAAGDHTHTLTISNTGGGQGHTHTLTMSTHSHTVGALPPYLKLAYFVKLP